MFKRSTILLAAIPRWVAGVLIEAHRTGWFIVYPGSEFLKQAAGSSQYV